MIRSPCLNKIFSFILGIFFSSVQRYFTWEKISCLVGLFWYMSRTLLVYLFIMIWSEGKHLIPGDTLVVIWLMIFKCPEHILWGSFAFHLWLTIITAVTFLFVNLTMIVVFIAVLHCGKHSLKTDVWGIALWA